MEQSIFGFHFCNQNDLLTKSVSIINKSYSSNCLPNNDKERTRKWMTSVGYADII